MFRKLKSWPAAIAALLISGSIAWAANTALSNLTASGAIAAANLIYVVQTAGSGGVKATMTQVATFINSLFSGDFTVASGGAATLKNTGPGATGPLGSATAAPIVTIDAQGRVTGLTSATVTPAVGSITGLGTGVGTALGDNVGSAGSFVVNGGVLGSPSSAGTIPAFTLGGTVAGGGNQLNNVIIGTTTPLSATFTNLSATGTTTLSATTIANLASAGTQCVQVSSTGAVSGTGAVCGGSGASGANPTATAGPAAVNGAATTFMRSDGAPAIQLGTAAQKGIVQVDGTTITAASGVITAVPGVTSRTATTTDTILSTDRGNVVFYNSASAIAVSQPAPTSSFAAGFFTTLCNINTGTPTVTPGSGTIDGGATYAIPAGTAASPSCISYQSDGTNFNAVDLQASYGANVQAALGKALSATGGVTGTIANGTATIPNTLISSQSCGSAITVAATNVLTADVVSAGFSADPTGTTGFLPTAMLTIVPYPTAGNANFKICNLTTNALTPTSLTFNWRVTR